MPRLILLFHEGGAMVSCDNIYRERNSIFIVSVIWEIIGYKAKSPEHLWVDRAFKFVVYFGLAATYSPTLSGSTIGAGELNCSVRNGKR